MPTGYTNKIYDNTEDYAFADYVWDCARAFGALMHMRDDQSEKIRKESFSSYHTEALEKAKKQLASLQEMSQEVAVTRAIADYEVEKERTEKAIQEKLELKKRYEDMMAQVVDWVPPTCEHEDLKEFMATQLKNSLEFDCTLRYYQEILDNLKQLTGLQWRDKEITGAQKDIDYHSQHLEEDNQRTNERNDWVDQLNESIPIPENKKGW